MKITFITGAMGRGGAERVISILSKHYAENGHQVGICTILHSNVEYELDERIKVTDLSRDDVGIKKDIIPLIRRLRKHFKATSPDVVVSFMAQNALIAGCALAGLGVRHIVSERIDPSMVNRGKIYETALHQIYGAADGVVLQTKRAYDYFPPKVRKKSTIILNPIGVKEYASEEKENRIVTVGRLEKQKNQKMLIDAIDALKDKHPEYILDIYGEGTLRTELEEYITEKGLTDRVFLRGNAADIHHKIASAKLFVLPSDFEGLSNALLEAMMMGLAVISTACSGSDEIIRDGENGMLVPVGGKAELISAMDKVLSNEELREKIARGANKSSELFKTENVISQWDSVILK